MILEFIDYFVVDSWLFHGATFAFVEKWFLMGSPYPVAAITLSYFSFVLKFGPDFMKKRPPFNLKFILFLFNASQVIWSAYIVYLCGKLMIKHGFIAKTCCLETEEDQLKIATAMYYYFLAKIFQLLDTIFFVLRKKTNQLSFLHVYHHGAMVVISWWILKYETTYTSIYFRLVNSLVHVFMYLYYAMSTIPSLARYLWWKKYITTMQLVHLASIIIHILLVYAISDCRPSFTLGFSTIFNNGLFFILFCNYYIKAYKNKKMV